MDGLGLNESVMIAIAVLIAIVAYLMGRSFFAYLLIGLINPVVAVIVLIVRHLRQPKDGAPAVKNLVSRIKLWMWSRKLEPGDFEDPKR